MPKKKLGLYVHIPFCQSKCAYCDFYSLAGCEESDMRRYTDALLLQMEDYAKAADAYAVDTVFIGGGTPTVLPVKCMSEILDGIHRHFHVARDAEFTMEANPATISFATLKSYRKAGVNRLSMGLQSSSASELRALSRIHSRSDFEASYAAARKAGFDNINADVMFGIPMQTAESFSRTLDYVTSLSPEHISVYDLKIEENTPFGRAADTLILPDEDTEVEMYLDCVQHLETKGYRHYEISNFARPGFECRHNLKYWNCEEYLGLGCAAHSYFGGRRFSFKRDLPLYMDTMEADMTGCGAISDEDVSVTPEYLRSSGILDECYEIRPNERVGEYVMLRLRLADGISCTDFERRFGLNFGALYGRRLSLYIDNGFMTFDGERYAFTPKGMFVSNAILSALLDFDSDSRLILSAADGSDKG